MTQKIKKESRQVMVNGMMSFDKLENGQHTADFVCTEHVEIEAFSGEFKVQALRNGCVTMVQKPKRYRGEPIRRGLHWSLSLTRDGMILINWRLPIGEIDKAPFLLRFEAQDMAEAITEVYEEILNQL
jgi:hypothetical protein